MKKFRQNFFEGIQPDWAKKNESIAKYFLETSEKNMFCKLVNKSAFLFFWGNSNLFKTYFLLGSLFPQNDRKSFFEGNLEYDTYESDIHTSLALLGYCMKPLVPK